MEEKLISAVFKRRPIWDPQDPLRRNSRVLSELWEDIADEIQVEVKTAKKRWKNLRAYFVKEIEKLHRPRTHVAVNHTRSSPWSYFTQLYFLNEIVSPSIVNKDINPSESRENNYCQVKNESSPDERVNVNGDANTPPGCLLPDGHLILKSESTTAVTHQSTPTTTTTTTTFYSNRDVIRIRKRSRAEMTNYQKECEVLEMEKKNVSLMDGISFEETSDLFFFKSLIPYMDKIPDVRKLKLRSDIQNLILREVESFERLKRVHFVSSLASSPSSLPPEEESPRNDSGNCSGTTTTTTATSSLSTSGIETSEEYVETCDHQSHNFDHDYVESK